jgi:hypothetical protein
MALDFLHWPPGGAGSRGCNGMRQRRRRCRRPRRRWDQAARTRAGRWWRDPAATQRCESLSGRCLQLSDRNGMRSGRRSRFLRTAPGRRRRRASLRKGRTGSQRRNLRAVDRLRVRFDLRGGSLPKALLRPRLDRLRDEHRALHSSAASPASGQPSRLERRVPLLSGQSVRRARTLVVRHHRARHHLPDCRPDRRHCLLAGRHGRRRLGLPDDRQPKFELVLPRRVHLRRRGLPKTLPRHARRWRSFVSTDRRRLRPLQPRSGGCRRVHAPLTLATRSDVGSIIVLARA